MPSSDKAKMVRDFSRSAPLYDRYANVQFRVADALLAELRGARESIFEIGCGTGHYTRLLRERYRTARLKACDISARMVEVAREKLRDEARRVRRRRRRDAGPGRAVRPGHLERGPAVVRGPAGRAEALRACAHRRRPAGLLRLRAGDVPRAGPLPAPGPRPRGRRRRWSARGRSWRRSASPRCSTPLSAG